MTRRRKYGDSAGGREKARERGEGGGSAATCTGERGCGLDPDAWV